jgi:hypothetical protein
MTDGDNSETFTLEGEDYTEKITVGEEDKVLLLLRRGIYGITSYKFSRLETVGDS